jgi:hypothetical protein
VVSDLRMTCFIQKLSSLPSFFFGGIGIWKASSLRSKSSTAWATPQGPFCSGYFGNGGLVNCLPALATNSDPPDLSLSSSLDYKYKPLGASFTQLSLTLFWRLFLILKLLYFHLMLTRCELTIHEHKRKLTIII